MPDGTAFLDRSPAVYTNGSNPSSEGVFPKGPLEGPQYKASLGEKLGADINKGAENRKVAGEKIGRFFSSMKQKLNRGVDIAFNVPGIAGTLGGEVGTFAKEKAERVKNSVVEAGISANNNIVDARDRTVDRVWDVSHRVNNRVVDVRDATREKIIKVSKNAAAWGLTNVADPIERSVEAFCQIPAEMQQMKADSAAKRAEELNARAAMEVAKGEARAAALKARAEKVDQETQTRLSIMGKAQEAANRKSQELNDKASENRGRVSGVFGKARALAAALRTT